MDYRDYKETLIKDVESALKEAGIEAKADFHTVEKINESYESLSVTPEGEKIGVNLNLEKIFEGVSDYESSIDTIVQAVKRGVENKPDIDVNNLLNYEGMKEKLAMEVVSIEANMEKLEKIPHKVMEDMAVVYRFILETRGETSSSILITNQMLDKMKVTAEELHNDALKNAPQLRPIVISGMNEILAEMSGMDIEELKEMGMAMDKEQMYVATVPDKNHGAGVLAYEDFMDQAAKRAGGDFFILPSSLHEILIVPDDGTKSVKELEAMVREVNATQVAPEDKLTDSVYHYDSESRIFELASKYEEREQTRTSVLEELEKVHNEIEKSVRKAPLRQMEKEVR